MPLEGAEALAAGHLPQPHRLVPAPREGEASVGAARHRGHSVRVPIEGTLFPAFPKTTVGEQTRQQTCHLLGIFSPRTAGLLPGLLEETGRDGRIAGDCVSNLL